MKISIIVPVYNEEKTIISVIEKLKELSIENKEIIIVDDGSTDNTKQILSQDTLLKDVKIIYHTENAGKGKAIQTGIQNSTGEIIAIQDADLEYDPMELIKLVDVFYKQPDTDAVYGSRFLQQNPNIYRRFLWGNKFLTWFINFLYGTSFTDTYTCYKIIKRSVMLEMKLESKRFEIEAEISCKLAKKKYKLVEIPINYNPRTLKEGKKINFRDAIKGVLTIIKYLNY